MSLKTKSIASTPIATKIRNQVRLYSDASNIVKLPFDIALPYAAEQNFHSDLRRGIIKSGDCWDNEEQEYAREAARILLEDGQNYIPTYEDMPWIVVSKISTAPFKTSERQTELIYMLGYHYVNPRFNRPDPTKHNDHRSILRYRVELARRFEFH